MRWRRSPKAARGTPESTFYELDDVLRIVRRRTPILWFGAFLYAGLLAFTAFVFAFVLGLTASQNRLEARQLQQEQQQAADSRAFASFLQQFVGETNYVCSVEERQAERLGLPAPALICRVGTPATPATPAPSPR